MTVARLLVLVCGMVLAALATAAARDPEPVETADPVPAGPDPYVLLDEAKLKLGEGRLAQARELLKTTPTADVEGYVIEEVLLQRMLVNSAFLRATHYLWLQLEAMELADTGYGEWLAGECADYAGDFADQAERYLELTAEGPQLDFVRFRLPVVTTEHLTDLELYTDPEILGPAVRNWDDGREGLGKGLIAGQARVALVLGAVRHYDRDSASPSLEMASERLRAGVPLDYAVLLDWIAGTARFVPDDDRLADLADRADRRLRTVEGGLELIELRERLAAEAAARAEAEAAAALESTEMTAGTEEAPETGPVSEESLVGPEENTGGDTTSEEV